LGGIVHYTFKLFHDDVLVVVYCLVIFLFDNFLGIVIHAAVLSEHGQQS